uniref:Uncharacterized protein n=1 Tax=Monodelphis domestica TaxID=13616 RepID=A0A5F8GZZ4_MONDO
MEVQQQTTEHQQQQLRNLWNFLLEACLDSCVAKLVHSNLRLMAAYVQLMPAPVQRHIADSEASAALAETTGSPARPVAGQHGAPGPGS